jgi:hypothetical protein
MYHESVWRIVASGCGIMSIVPNVKTIGNYCSQFFMGTKRRWRDTKGLTVYIRVYRLMAVYMLTT